VRLSNDLHKQANRGHNHTEQKEYFFQELRILPITSSTKIEKKKKRAMIYMVL